MADEPPDLIHYCESMGWKGVRRPCDRCGAPVWLFAKGRILEHRSGPNKGGFTALDGFPTIDYAGAVECSREARADELTQQLADDLADVADGDFAGEVVDLRQVCARCKKPLLEGRPTSSWNHETYHAACAEQAYQELIEGSHPTCIRCGKDAINGPCYRGDYLCPECYAFGMSGAASDLRPPSGAPYHGPRRAVLRLSFERLASSLGLPPGVTILASAPLMQAGAVELLLAGDGLPASFETATGAFARPVDLDDLAAKTPKKARCCSWCGSPFTPGELVYQIGHTEDRWLAHASCAADWRKVNDGTHWRCEGCARVIAYDDEKPAGTDPDGDCPLCKACCPPPEELAFLNLIERLAALPLISKVRIAGEIGYEDRASYRGKRERATLIATHAKKEGKIDRLAELVTEVEERTDGGK